MSSAWCASCRRWFEIKHLKHETDAGLLHSVEHHPLAPIARPVRVESVDDDAGVYWYVQEQIDRHRSDAALIIASDERTPIAAVRVLFAETPDGRPMTNEVTAVITRLLTYMYAERREEITDEPQRIGYKTYASSNAAPLVEIHVNYDPERYNRDVIIWELENAVRATVGRLTEERASDEAVL